MKFSLACDKEAPKQENPKIRTDLSVSIFEQLTLPVRDSHTTNSEQKVNIQQSDTETVVNSVDAASEITVSEFTPSLLIINKTISF